MASPTPEPGRPAEPEPRVRPARIPPGSPLRALLSGLIIDFGGSMFVGVLLEIGYSLRLSATGLTPAQVQALLDDLPPDSPVAVAAKLLGALCSVAGGYVCARILRREEYRIAALMAGFSVFIGLLTGVASEPPDMVFLLTACEIACVLLGAKYARVRNLQEGARPRGARP